MSDNKHCFSLPEYALSQGSFSLEIPQWQICEGECWGILGPNGSGKTTLLNWLVTHDDLTEGWRELKESGGIAYVPQWCPIPQLKVQEYLSLGAYPRLGRLASWESYWKDESLQSLVKDFLLEPHLQKPVGCLSGGEFQRLRLVRALVQEPSILVTDEPANHLDWVWQLRLLGSIRGRSSIWVSSHHDINLALRLCNRFLVLCQGECCFLGSREAMLESRILEDVYGVKITIVEDQDVGIPQVLMGGPKDV